MSASRAEFLERIAAFGDAAQSEALAVKPPADTAHNARGRLLRNGLAVVGFTTLEDFIRRRTVEALNSLSAGNLRFGDLPAKLQKAATLGAVSSLSFQATLRRGRGDDAIKYVQDIAKQVASTAGAAFELPEISLGFSSSNLSPDDLASILGAFQVEQAWQQIDHLAKRTGLGTPPPYRDVFTGAVRMRNCAAHDGAFDVPTTDLIAFQRNATAVAVSFDLLLSRCIRLLRDTSRSFVAVEASKIRLRFVDGKLDGTWREWIEGRKRAVRVRSDGRALFIEAISRAAPVFDAVVLREANGIPADWCSTDLV